MILRPGLELAGPYAGLVDLCWGAFLVVWIVGAIYNYRYAPPVAKRGNPLLPWVVGIALAIVLSLVPDQLWRTLTVDVAGLRLLGAAILVLSTAWTLWARGVLGEMWTSSPVARAGHRLRTSGPYAVTRHPIYTGILGMLLGTALGSGLGAWLAILVVAFIILELKIRAEERLLRETFGARYDEYRRRVPQLLPWVGVGG